MNRRNKGLTKTPKSGEESILGKTGKVRMEINAVTNPVQYAPVIYAATNPTLTGTPTLVTECEVTLNPLGNCYGCNKPGHVKKDCPEKNQTQICGRECWSMHKRRVFHPCWDGEIHPCTTNCEIKGNVLIKIRNKTVTGPILLEIVYNIKKKLGCIFIQNHNSESLDLLKGQMIGLVTSCVVKQEEQGQRPEKPKEDMQRVTGQGNDADTLIGSASRGNTKKAGRKAGSVKSKENKCCYETEEEKCQFICECFQLDMKTILNADAKLKEAVIE